MRARRSRISRSISGSSSSRASRKRTSTRWAASCSRSPGASRRAANSCIIRRRRVRSAGCRPAPDQEASHPPSQREGCRQGREQGRTARALKSSAKARLKEVSQGHNVMTPKLLARLGSARSALSRAAAWVGLLQGFAARLCHLSRGTFGACFRAGPSLAGPVPLLRGTGLAARRLPPRPCGASARGSNAAALIGFWFGFGYFLAGLYWVAEAFLVEPWRHGWLIPFVMTAYAGRHGAVLCRGGRARHGDVAARNSPRVRARLRFWPGGVCARPCAHRAPVEPHRLWAARQRRR